MRRAAAIGLIPVAFLFGWAAASIPGVPDTAHFWNGNWSWPYLLAGGLGCVLARRWWTRLLLAPTAMASMVLGFYNVFRLLSATADQLGLPRSASHSEVLRAAIDNYLRLNVLRPDGWITISVVVGVGMATSYSLLERRGRGRLLLVGVAVLGFIEPMWHFAVPRSGPLTGYTLDRSAAVGVLVQMAVAALVLFAGMRGRRSTSRSDTMRA
ncbi:hypothetical protein Back2_15430 [Nocardioides baekrokdamisoli]|uniref:Uncharacterized protein n=1 Tax=Nocardioides baekrokdamisoli TaxID=1804624 RepID=A0A3G9IG06_9ACTN|nr:hypothetical protein [Nocardioides baekrokdamisoli]BBH17256.1 hypothetical protein Back2_15430 [Nocardioides baekrokdamisoli]